MNNPEVTKEGDDMTEQRSTPNCEHGWPLTTACYRCGRRGNESASTATKQSSQPEWLRDLISLHEQGNGWNPIEYPGRANDAERAFRSKLVADWPKILKALSSVPSANRRMSELVPTNWLDPLLTGPAKVLGAGHAYTGKDIENLLQAVKQRIERAEAGDVK